MLLFLFGKDSFRLSRRRKYLKDEFRRKYPEGELLIVDAEESKEGIGRRTGEFLVPGLFDVPRLLSLEHAEALADPDRKVFLNILINYVSAKDRIILVSYSGKPKIKDPLVTTIKKFAENSEEFDTLSGADARAFLQAEAKQVSSDVSFSRMAADRILSVCGSDAARLSSLAETLALYRGSGEIGIADADLFVAENQKEKVFVALDALVAGDRGRASGLLLREARADSGGVMKLFGLLAWQIREFLKVRGEYDRGLRASTDIARACGMHPFVARKLLSKIHTFPLSRLRQGVELLASLDADMKSGRADPELALTLFVKKF